MTRLIAAILVPALCLAACSSPTQATKTTAAKTTGTTAKASPKVPSKAESLTGTAVAPAGMVAAGAGNMVAAGAGNMVAAGAGNMVAAGAGNYRTGSLGPGYGLLAVDEQPLANAPVWLVPADEKGEMPSREPDAVTDAKGNFTLPVEKTSATGAYAVVVGGQTAAGKPAPLSTVVEANPAGKSTRVGAASTMVAATLRARGLGAFANFDLAAFTALVDLMGANLAEGDLPDFSDPESVIAKADELGKRVEAIGSAIQKMGDGLEAWGDNVSKDPTSILNGGLPGLPGLPL